MAIVRVTRQVVTQPKVGAFVNLIYAYDDVTLDVAEVALEQNGFDDYEMTLGIRREGADPVEFTGRNTARIEAPVDTRDALLVKTPEQKPGRPPPPATLVPAFDVYVRVQQVRGNQGQGQGQGR